MKYDRRNSRCDIGSTSSNADGAKKSSDSNLGRKRIDDYDKTSAPDPWAEVAVDFSSGMFRGVCSELVGIEMGKGRDSLCLVQGAIPHDLPAGTYLRNGPNPQFSPRTDQPYHYFDGDGMIASFRFAGAESTSATRSVTFNHRWVQTERWISDRRRGASSYEFGSLSVGKPIFHEVLNDAGERMGKANTSLVYHGGKLLALEEADVPYEVKLTSLDTVGKYTFNGALEPGSVFTAHPKLDPVTGELIGYGCAFGPRVWQYYVISPGRYTA